MPLERFLTYRLHLIHKLTDQTTAAAYGREFALPLGEARCLAAIGNAERLGAGAQTRLVPVSVNALALESNLTKSQASRAAQGLVSRGLATKSASPTDGRGVALALSPPGRRLWRRVMRLIARRNQEIFGCFTNAEQQQFGALLDRLIDAARTQGGAHDA